MTIEQNLGKRVTLMVVKKVEFGVYLGTDDDKVLLPGKQVPENLRLALNWQWKAAQSLTAMC